MNGVEIVHALSERLKVIETKFEERWQGHDKLSNKCWTELGESLKGVNSSLVDLKTAFAAQPLKCFEKMETKVKKTIGSYVAVILVLAAIVTLIIQMI